MLQEFCSTSLHSRILGLHSPALRRLGGSAQQPAHHAALRLGREGRHSCSGPCRRGGECCPGCPAGDSSCRRGGGCCLGSGGCGCGSFSEAVGCRAGRDGRQWCDTGVHRGYGCGSCSEVWGRRAGRHRWRKDGVNVCDSRGSFATAGTRRCRCDLRGWRWSGVEVRGRGPCFATAEP